jgi:hypothetical protein
MKVRVKAYRSEDLDNSNRPYRSFERFRPAVSPGIRGWGQKGVDS